MEDTTTLIDDQFKTLPPSLQHAISLTPWKDAVQEISIANKLSDDASSSLETETMLVLYGFETETDFPQNLVQGGEISIELAERIALLVEEKVFSPIIETSKKLETEVEAKKIELVSTNHQSPRLDTLSKILETKKSNNDWSNKGFSPNIDLSKQIEIEAPEPEPLLDAPKKEVVVAPIETTLTKSEVPPIATPVAEPLFPEIKIEPTKKIINILDLPQYTKSGVEGAKPLVPMNSHEKSGGSLSPEQGFVVSPPQIPTAQEVPKEIPTISPQPKDSRYAGGIDPYREQI